MRINHDGHTLHIEYNSEGQIAEIQKHGNKFFEIQMLKAIAKLPYRPGICLDIGANVGNHTIYFSRFCNFDEVWAYEPDPDSFALLQYNVEENTTRTVRAFNVAIGNKTGTVRMTSDPVNPSRNHITKGGGREVPIVPITTNLQVALIKIDVEGHELEVIKGAYDVINRERPELFIEHHGDPSEILQHLPAGYGYVRTYNNAPTHHYTSQSK